MKNTLSFLVLPTNLSITLSRHPQVGLSVALGALNATELVETVDTVEDLAILIPNNGAFVQRRDSAPY